MKLALGDTSKRMLRRLAVAAAATMLVPIVAAQPAQADVTIQGGCSGSAVASCISLSGGTTLVADLYMNVAFDSSRCTAYIDILKSNGAWMAGGGPYNIQSNGRRGPVTKNIITLPPSHGSARNRVSIYTCDGRFHHYQYSPYQSY